MTNKIKKHLPKNWKKKAITALMSLFLIAAFGAAVTSVVTNLASAQAEQGSECPLSVELHFLKTAVPVCYDTTTKQVLFTIENGINIDVSGLIINIIGLSKAVSVEDDHAVIKKVDAYQGKIDYDSKTAGPIRLMKITPKINLDGNEQICLAQAITIGKVLPCT